ncbi:MAG: hypothetical protein GXO61_00020 [Epsilonproteobacteria bacterium]|nr:hypothetical protein [Campylobacterota bacterium]
MKQLTILFFLSFFLFAGEYITLDNGKVILLKPDGTWQEVQVVKKGGETIAIKPDGTWEKIEANKIEAANKLEMAVDKKYKDNPLVQTLIGKWKGDGISYEFTLDTATMKKREGHTNRVISGKWSVEKVDEPNRLVVVNIAEGARLGFLTFGGDIRKLRVMSKDTIIDESERLEGRIYTLHRVQ